MRQRSPRKPALTLLHVGGNPVSSGVAVGDGMLERAIVRCLNGDECEAFVVEATGRPAGLEQSATGHIHAVGRAQTATVALVIGAFVVNALDVG